MARPRGFEPEDALTKLMPLLLQRVAEHFTGIIGSNGMTIGDCDYR